MAKRDSAQNKWKKKKWYELVTPTFNASLGETVAEEPDAVVGKVVQANMMNIIKSPRMQAITMRFKVVKMEDGKGVTQPISYTMAPSALKRLVRSRRDRIDDSFVIKTKDEQSVRIKPLVITQANGTAAQRTAIRAKLVESVSAKAAELEYEALVTNVIEQKIQKEVKLELNKVMPIRTIEIRAFQKLPQ